MRPIAELSVYMDKIVKKAIPNMVEATKETAQTICEDVKNLAPFDTGLYENSIKVYPTKKTKDEISTFIGSDMTVTSKSTGTTYNLGFLLETGTDPHAIPNAFGWGDIYGYDSDKYKRTLDPNWHPGTISQPHYKPALQKNEITFKNNIAKAIREAEK